MTSSIQAVFIDRDGTIGGNGHFIHPREFTMYPFAVEAIKLLKAEKIKIFAFTNQHRISRGEATEQEFVEQFLEFGFDGAYICPHAPSIECSCRKPAPGMLFKAALEHNLDLNRCVVIGDVGEADMLAAYQAGAMKILVRTGWGEESITTHRNKWAYVEPDYVADNILDAVKWLLKK